MNGEDHYKRAFEDTLSQLNAKTKMVDELKLEVQRLKEIEVEYGNLKIQYLEKINHILEIIVEASRLKK